MCRKQNFWVLKWHSSLDFYFLLSLLPSFFTFLTSFCFSFAGDLVGFILVGKVFVKACRIFNRIRGKERLVGSGTRFLWKFSGQCFIVFCLFLWCSWLNYAHSGIWCERSLLSAQVSRQSCPWTIKLISAQVEEGTWIRMGSYGQFRNQWVNFA